MRTLLLATLLLAGCATTHRQPASENSSPAAALKPGPSHLYQGPLQITLEGQTRAPAKAYLPVQYDAKKAWPLLVMLHGFSGTADTEDTYLGLRFRASLRGFILLEPEGTVMPKGTMKDGKDMSGNQFWNATDTCCDFAKTGVDDGSYVLALVQKLKAEYNISQVYLFGHSNGGFLANRLACESPGTFSAIASLAGGTYMSPEACRVASPASYLQIHAVDDKTILYQNAPDYAGGKETISQWLRRDGCSRDPESGPEKDFVFLIPGKDTKPQTWKDCSSGKEVALWTIKPFSNPKHAPHIPLFNLNFTDAVLDFLFHH